MNYSFHNYNILSWKIAERNVAIRLILIWVWRMSAIIIINFINLTSLLMPTYGNSRFQEVGNVPYVVENGCGKFSKTPKEIANIVAQWFGPNAGELEAMSQNCLKLARPDAVFKIVHDLHELVRQKNFVPQFSCAS